MKTTTKKKQRPSQGMSLDEERKRLNAALDRMRLPRGGHRGMHHGPKKKS